MAECRYDPFVESFRRRPPRLDLIDEHFEGGILVLRPRLRGSDARRRILFISDYGMARAWRLWKDGVYPGNHLWGCIELATKGYEVILPEPPVGRALTKRLRNDWFPTLSAIRRLRADDIVYCGHNVLLWTPLLKRIGLLRCKVVGLLYAREPLPLGNAYDAIITHTPVAQTNAARMYPKTLCEHISWGMDLDFFHTYPYQPKWMLSCGKTFRDFQVVAKSFEDLDVPARVLHPDPDSIPRMPPSVQLESGRAIGEGIYAPLAEYYYRYASATLLTISPDPTNRHSIGLTNVFESMACGRPVISTKTSAMTSEVDIEELGIGLYVPPRDPVALRSAILRLVSDPTEAQSMGSRGRRLCEQFFNMDRFADDLHQLFQKL